MKGKRAIQAEQPGDQSPVRLAAPQPPPRLSRRERRKIATRAALLKAAQEVIAVKGVYLAVIEEITERADVAKGSFYQYFHDRDDLLHALLTLRLEELRALIESTPPAGTFPERVRLLIHHHLDYFLRHEDFLLLLHQIRGFIKMKGDATPGAVREAYRRHLVFLAQQLLPPDTPSANGKAGEEGACALLGMLTGFLSHYAILSPLADVAHDMQRMETALTNACLAFWQR
jgi:AcrR family transcriptional regulator